MINAPQQLAEVHQTYCFRKLSAYLGGSEAQAIEIDTPLSYRRVKLKYHSL